VFESGTYEASSNYGNFDEGVVCQFIAFAEGQPQRSSDLTCVGYDATGCTASIYDGPLTPPPTSPTATPDVPSPTTAQPPSGESPPVTGPSPSPGDSSSSAAASTVIGWGSVMFGVALSHLYSS